ncbi:hypothetical protein E2C01_002882 [Portunus trituberculatus]|uniref:Uncharacterized protein n=1 Tax=Portunus trituberculatus TaxID=210409 RepID=A0A5B7CLF8_PORTR|nr:hypothetical protein [Portunus trituberculatus]
MVPESKDEMEEREQEQSGEWEQPFRNADPHVPLAVTYVLWLGLPNNDLEYTRPVSPPLPSTTNTANYYHDHHHHHHNHPSSPANLSGARPLASHYQKLKENLAV